MHASIRATLTGTLAALALCAAACGGSTTSTTSAGPAPATRSMPGSAEPFGPACSAVPASGSGSFSGMAKDPVATAASHNPELSTLVSAVRTAGLVDTLNTADAVTVFAPANSAFAAMDQATLRKAMADPKGLLTTVLTAHVLAGRLAPDQLAGKHETLQGGTVTVTGSGENFTVNGTAKVVCGNVQTANATVYIVDGVLSPM
jgi:uncharacterized surface protein with fasciclin (FAS1) repeats